MTRFGNNLSLRLRYAELLLQSGNLNEGKRLADELTASRVPNIERAANWMLAQMYAQIRMYDEAIAHGQKTLRLMPEAVNVQVFLAQQYLASGEPTLARRALERALRLSPENQDLIVLMTEILVRLDEREEAVALLDERLEQNPEDDRLRMRKTEVLIQSPDWRKAVSDTRTLLEKYPDNAGLKNNLAFLLARSGQDLDLALELVESLREQAEQNPVILDTFGYVLAAHGRHEEALEAYERALQQAGGNMTIRFHYAKSLAAVGRTDEALRQLEAVLMISPDFPQAEEARALQNEIGVGG
jgi:predicted Zn-dependent protease